MSEFHGGFFVLSRDPRMQEPVRAALAERLRAMRLDPERHRVTFATCADAPIVHVAVRGPAADGKDYAFFHLEHESLGADVARASKAVVWAYAYENQTGSENVARYEPDGTRARGTYASWDEVANEIGVDFAAPGARKALFDALPLGVLATELGVPRELLDMKLAYDTPSVAVPLAGRAEPDALARYLSGPLAPMPVRIEPETGATQTLFFPRAMAEDAQALAKRLSVSVGRVFTAAWEVAKPEMYPTAAGIGANGEEAAPLATPPSRPLPELRIPATAPPLGDLAADGKVKLTLAIPEAMLEEVAAWARHLDRSLSWCMQRAYRTARARLHATTRA